MISVSHLSKSFKVYKKPSHRLKELLLRKPCHKRHVVLHDINFTVADGEALAILGRNGAGKSTLLKILTGVLEADAGEIQLSGKLTALLELGTGFDMNLTGLQNIRTNGLLIGMTPEEIEQRRQTIIDFSELGDSIDEPIRTYSSGMVMRLAFAISIHAEPDIFLIDEALSVGDGRFQQKCMRKIRQFRSEGGSIVFVSHDLNAVKMLCDRAIVLERGHVVANDEPEVAVNTYNQILGADSDVEVLSSQPENGYGSYEATIEKASLLGVDSNSTVVTSGEQTVLAVQLTAAKPIPAVTLGLMIRDRFGQDIFGTNTHHMDFSIALNKAEPANYTIQLPMLLAPGKYTITLALHEGVDHTRHCYHWWDNAISFEVAGIRGPQFGGICNLSPSISQC
jgi:lipopolysaccharide transport system ATP-binding protein